MTAAEILKQLEQYGDDATKTTLMKHGAKEPLFGVKVADLKKILSKTKKNHELSLELYKTGNSDAMYLAGLMADEKKITMEQLEEWADKAYWYYLSEYAVPWVAAETEFGFQLGLKWIKSKEERIATAGWATLAYYAGVNDDSVLDIKKYGKLLDTVAKEIHSSQNLVRRSMNNFIISIGSFITELTEKSIKTAEQVGQVYVDMGGTSCKTPLAKDYILNLMDKGRIGKKRKTARC